MFKNPFSFKGRIRRTEYGLSYLMYIAGYFMSAMIIVPFEEIGVVVFFILFIVLFWFLLAQGAKRCHDRGNSGIFQIIPFYGLWMLFADSDPGPNQYGPNPEGLGNNDEINQIGKPEDSI